MARWIVIATSSDTYGTLVAEFKHYPMTWRALSISPYPAAAAAAASSGPPADSHPSTVLTCIAAVPAALSGSSAVHSLVTSISRARSITQV